MTDGRITLGSAAKGLIPIARLALKLVLAPVALLAMTWWFVSAETTARLSHPNGLTLLAVLLNEIGLFITAIRMRGTLAQFSIAIDVLRAFRIHLQSLFYFIVVPGSIGLELARYAKIRTLAPDVSDFDLALSLLADRFLGLLASLVITLAMLPFIGFPVAYFVSGPGIAIAGVALGVLLVLVFLLRRYAFFERLITAGSMILERPLSFIGLLALSVASQGAIAIAVFLAAASVGVTIPVTVVLFGLSAALFSMLLPVSFVGAGPAEAAAVGLLMVLGIPAPDAVLIAALNYAARFLGGLQGGVLEMAETGTAWRAVFGNKA